jgi:hypothetical protein
VKGKFAGPLTALIGYGQNSNRVWQAVVMSKGIEPSSNAGEAAVPSLHCTRMSDNLRSFPRPWHSSQAPGLLKNEMGLLGLACLFQADLIFCKPPASTIRRSHEFSAKPNPAK